MVIMKAEEERGEEKVEGGGGVPHAKSTHGRLPMDLCHPSKRHSNRSMIIQHNHIRTCPRSVGCCFTAIPTNTIGVVIPLREPSVERKRPIGRGNKRGSPQKNCAESQLQRFLHVALPLSGIVSRRRGSLESIGTTLTVFNLEMASM